MNDLILRIPLTNTGTPPNDTLTLECRAELFELVRELDKLHGKDGEDDYGYPLRYLTVAKLLELSADDSVRDNWRNRAVWAFLGQLPREWPIVLFWS